MSKCFKLSATIGDYDNIIHIAAEAAHARGLAQGEAKGREEGFLAKALEIARSRENCRDIKRFV